LKFVGYDPSDPPANLVFSDGGGSTVFWANSGSAFTQTLVPNSALGPEWTADGVGDFSGDGRTDVLSTNTSGQVAISELSGPTLTGFGIPAGQMGSEWHVVGIGDFNGDSKSDILWKSTSGNADVWSMDGTQLLSDHQVEDKEGVLGQMGSEWHPVTTGDFNGDGKSDILWENTSGNTDVWSMDGAQLLSDHLVQDTRGVLGQMGSEWHVAGAGNFDGDKTADLVWVDTNNNVQIWDMDGSQISQVVTPDAHQEAGWQLKAVGDFTGIGAKDDLLWLRSDGAAQVWHVTGTQVTVTQPTTPTGDILLGL
jgi:hypothetical protein